MNGADANTLRKVFGDAVGADASTAGARFAERADRDGLAEVVYAPFDSPIGHGWVARTERGVVSLALPNRGEDEFLDQLAAGISPRVLELPGRLDDVRRELDEYFAGRRESFELPLDWRLVRSDFYGRVLRETARLPYGVTSTYGEIAAAAGNSRAHRAAGTALGINPVPLIVPCHRVLRAGGVLGNYGGGPEVKAFLLRLEGAIGT